jgi:hypothetical protein
MGTHKIISQPSVYYNFIVHVTLHSLITYIGLSACAFCFVFHTQLSASAMGTGQQAPGVELSAFGHGSNGNNKK